MSSQFDVVREYYFSLLREEFHRLCIVEFSENLGNIDQRLESFLRFEIDICKNLILTKFREHVGYLTEWERREIIVEFMGSMSTVGEKVIEVNNNAQRRVADSGD